MSKPLPRRSFLTRLSLAVGSAALLPFTNFARALDKEEEQEKNP